MALKTILRIKCNAALYRGVVLVDLCYGLIVCFENPENRNHERNKSEHKQCPVPGLFNSVGTGIKYIEQRSHNDQQHDYAYCGLNRIYHKNTTFNIRASL